MAAANASADMIVGTIETLAIGRYGLDARMRRRPNLPPERDMIHAGIAAGFAQMPTDTQKRISELSAPLMGLLGGFLYLSRLGSLEQRLRANRAEDMRASTAQAVYDAERITQDAAQRNGTAPDVVGTVDAPDKDTLHDLMG